MAKHPARAPLTHLTVGVPAHTDPPPEADRVGSVRAPTKTVSTPPSYEAQAEPNAPHRSSRARPLFQVQATAKQLRSPLPRSADAATRRSDVAKSSPPLQKAPHARRPSLSGTVTGQKKAGTVCKKHPDEYDSRKPLRRVGKHTVDKPHVKSAAGKAKSVQHKAEYCAISPAVPPRFLCFFYILSV